MQATRLGEPAVALFRLPVPDQVLSQSEDDVRPRHFLGGLRPARAGALRIESMVARRTPDPVAIRAILDSLAVSAAPLNRLPPAATVDPAPLVIPA